MSAAKPAFSVWSVSTRDRRDLGDRPVGDIGPLGPTGRTGVIRLAEGHRQNADPDRTQAQAAHADSVVAPSPGSAHRAPVEAQTAPPRRLSTVPPMAAVTISTAAMGASQRPKMKVSTVNSAPMPRMNGQML